MKIRNQKIIIFKCVRFKKISQQILNSHLGTSTKKYHIDIKNKKEEGIGSMGSKSVISLMMKCIRLTYNCLYNCYFL